MILADEINRTPPKTQAALLEAMQEHQVTAAGVRHALPEPFFVLATQNPIEMEGTYPLPEAQLDRFMFNVVIDYLPEDDEVAVVTQTTVAGPAQSSSRCSPARTCMRFHDLVRKVPIAEELVRYAVRLAAASRPHQTGHAGFRQRMGELGRRHARRTIPRARRESPRVAARPRARDRRRYSRARAAHAAPSHPAQLPRRSRRRDASRAVIERLVQAAGRDRQTNSRGAISPCLNRNTRASLIHPKALMAIRNLELRARIVVEGFWNGLHRSPYHGFSVEFTEYRQYSPGDDPRYLDWRVFARSDRYYIKKFEDETNLRCHLLVDHSQSMGYGSLGYTKSEYANTLAATIAYFLFKQGDAVGLLTFDEHVARHSSGAQPRRAPAPTHARAR